MNKKINVVFLSLSTLVLAACGGGDGPEFTPTPEVKTIVDNAQFKDASTTNVYFGANLGTSFYNERDFGRTASHCYTDANSYYLETENTLVFGSSYLPESDFRTVASWVESEIDNTASAFGGMTFSEVVAKRNNIAPEVMGQIYSYLRSFKFDSIDYPTNFDDFNEMGWVEQDEWFGPYFRSLDTQKQNQIIEEAGTKDGMTWQADQYRLTNKLLVCLHEGTDQFNYGEGTRFGLSVAAPSINKPSDVLTIIKHELVHTFQGMLYDSSYNAFLLPNWFSEGQAVYLSGQDVASVAESADYHATHFVDYTDQNGIDPGKLYKHYGLAYKYLNDANNVDKMIQVITGMNNSQFNGKTTNYHDKNKPAPSGIDYDFNDGYTSHYLPFIDSFDNAGLVDADGEMLKLRRWKRDYDMLIK